jgi:hypothetical protein
MQERETLLFSRIRFQEDAIHHIPPGEVPQGIGRVESMSDEEEATIERMREL